MSRLLGFWGFGDLGTMGLFLLYVHGVPYFFPYFPGSGGGPGPGSGGGGLAIATIWSQPKKLAILQKIASPTTIGRYQFC